MSAFISKAAVKNTRLDSVFYGRFRPEADIRATALIVSPHAGTDKLTSASDKEPADRPLTEPLRFSKTQEPVVQYPSGAFVQMRSEFFRYRGAKVEPPEKISRRVPGCW